MKNPGPRNPPSLHIILNDLGNPNAKELAKYLGVNERTIYAWKAKNQAPRHAMWALFWLSSYGQSALYCDLFNGYQMQKSLTDMLRHENTTLRIQAQKKASEDAPLPREPLKLVANASF